MIATHQIQNIDFQNEMLLIDVDGRHYQFQLKEISSKLANATDVERNFYKVSASGYGIHWPLIDEDLSLDALLKR
ncbi:MAG: DUF2442 domain-containing protein [Bacteroidetes bacterium]|nr:DUF2442 domain-containing protein [Bacteroidota bacterium]MBU1485679.1 DUF2442 domain-containing protein [Bacteroidota bacterium]MBU2266939.1 DUF2442 domain-containing protein [Bacteroidota bacterium]MBU2375767.1 DUF2442 domain-containing protein [Bacteroidota bacterium]